MADEQNSEASAQEEAGDDVSWEDAFQEATEEDDAAGDAVHEGSEAEKSPPGVAAAPDSGGATAGGGVDIDFLLDLPLELTVQVGRKKMLINEMLQLGQGSVIPLEKDVGEPFEVYVNGKLMAFGEVVVVNEKFGIRLTDVIDPKDRIQQLA